MTEIRNGRRNGRFFGTRYLVAAVAAALLAQGCGEDHWRSDADRWTGKEVPVRVEDATLTFAPNVPPPITRKRPAVVNVKMYTEERIGVLMEGLAQPTLYTFWTFNGKVPGPFIRVRVGDTLRLHFENRKNSLMPHNVDFHAVTGPGGGGEVTITQPGQSQTVQFKLLNPGLYIYHCAVPPIPHHVANGMYGLILVEPADGLPKADREYYVLQSEFYTEGAFGEEGLQVFSPSKGALEQPTYVVFNGQVGSMMGDRALKAKVGERVRIFFGNAGPNLVSSFHVIGEVFDRVYAEGSTTNPLTNVQTTLVPAGGSAVVEFKTEVPGTFTLVDHSIFRLDKGCLGMLKVEGKEAPHIYRRESP